MSPTFNNHFLEDLKPPIQAIKYTLQKYNTGDNDKYCEDNNTLAGVHYAFSPLIEFSHLSIKKLFQSFYSMATAEEPIQNRERKLSQNIESNFHNPSPRNMFHNFMHIPDIYLNYNNHTNKPIDTLPTLVHHNSQHLNNTIYVLGGLCTLSSIDDNFPKEYIKDKLPHEINLSDFKYHFPYELPSPISKTMLSNPFLSTNQNLYTMNNTTSTLTFKPITGGDIPPPLLMLSSTVISKRHIFYYGGFNIINDRMAFDEQDGKWVIYKKIIMNNDAYILDTITSRFTKIALKSNITGKHFPGRIGNALVSNVYDPSKEPQEPKESKSSTHTRNSSDLSDSENHEYNYASKYITNGSQKVKNHQPNAACDDGDVNTAPESFKFPSTNISEPISKNSSSVLLASKEISKDTSNLMKKGHKIYTQIKKKVHTPNPSIGRLPNINIDTHSFHLKSHSRSSSLKDYVQSPISASNKTSTSTMASFNPSIMSNRHSRETTFETFDVEADDLIDNHSAQFIASTREERAGSQTHTENIANVVLFVFGGFILDDPDEEGISVCKESDELLRIELIMSFKRKSNKGKKFFAFNKEAIITSFNDVLRPRTGINDEVWPSSRGFFGSCISESTHLFANSTGSYSFFEPTKSGHWGGKNTNKKDKIADMLSPLKFYKDKLLVIQGGITSKNEGLSDLYVFAFNTCKWMKLETFSKMISSVDGSPTQIEPAKFTLCFHQMFSVGEYILFIGGLSRNELHTVNNVDLDRKNYLLDASETTDESDGQKDITDLFRDTFLSTSENDSTVKSDGCNRLCAFNLRDQTYIHPKCFNGLHKYISPNLFADDYRMCDLLNSKTCVTGASSLIANSRLIVTGGHLRVHKYVSLTTSEQAKKVEEQDGVGYLDGSDILLGSILTFELPISGAVCDATLSL